MNRKCLIIIPGIPFPPVDGHKLKIYNLIKILNKNYALHIVTIARTIPNEAELSFIEAHSYKHSHFMQNIAQSLRNMCFNLFSNIPYQVSYFTLPEVKRYLKEDQDNYEFVFLNLIRTAGYLPELSGNKIVLDMVDLLSKSYLKSSNTTSSPVYKTIYSIEASRLLRYEKLIIEQCALTLCVNQQEAESLNEIGKVAWLPNGVKESLFQYDAFDQQYANGIAFFGTMFYQPNIDAVLWFEKYVMDKLNPDIKLYIIGARPASIILQMAKKRKNVIITGFLDDPYLLLNSCFAHIAPMQNGGGIQNKVLETMGMGKINILTSHGANPIKGGINGSHFLVEDEAFKMATLINDLFENPVKYEHIKANAKQLIMENYTWQAYERKLSKLLTTIGN